MPKRIQLKRKKGWRLPKGAIIVDRRTAWGNPFTIDCEAWRFSTTAPYRIPTTLSQVLANYRYMALAHLSIFPDWLDALRGKDLACWCKLDQACHADILLELAAVEGEKE